MSFAKKSSRSFDVPFPRPSRPRVPASAVVRAIVLAAFVVVAAAWALSSHYNGVHPPMVGPAAPAPRSAPTYDADAGEMPVPDTFWDEG